MFNLRKFALEGGKPYDKLLTDMNKQDGLAVDENPGTTDWQLKQKSHKNKDNTVPFEEQLDAERTGSGFNGNIEKKLDKDPKVYADRRTDKAYATTVKSTDLVNEAYDQKRYEVFREAESGVEQDTMFWDKYIGTDVKTKTKILKQKAKSQLAQHPDRFKGLDNTMPIQGTVSEDAKTLSKEDKVISLVVAQLKDADAMLFHVFANAGLEDRGLNDDEKLTVNNVNAGKSKAIAFLNGVSKQKFAIKSKDGIVVCERFFQKGKDNSLTYKERKIEPFKSAEEAAKAHPDLFIAQ